MSDDAGQITILLQRLSRGDQDAEKELVPMVYKELHAIANHQLRLERPGHTLQATAVINELYLRLMRDKAIDWQSRAHLYAVAAQTIRHIMVDHARARAAKRRPNPDKRLSIDDVFVYSQQRSEDVLALDEALEKLSTLDARQARIVEMRFFGGLTVEEIASVLDISERTVKREWSFARAWLSRFLGGSETADEAGAGK